MCAAEDREAGLTVGMFFPHAFPRAFRHGGLCFLLYGDPSSRVSSLSFLSVSRRPPLSFHLGGSGGPSGPDLSIFILKSSHLGKRHIEAYFPIVSRLVFFPQ